MARLKKTDSQILTHRHSGGAPRRAPGIVWSALVLLSLGLMLLSRLDHSYVRWTRAVVADAMAPVLDAVRGPLEPVRWSAHQAASYFEMVDSFDRLKRENRELEYWRARAGELERQLGDLSELARVAREPDIPVLTARVIASAPGALGATLLLGVGRGQKVLAGHAVMDAGGLVGRVVHSHEQSARVLLLTDHKSRIPVHVGTGRVRALMIGDNGPLPRLAYLPSNAEVKPGDAVVTSGVGGVLPRGLRVGEVVASEGGRTAVRLLARLDALDYVSVLLYAAPELELSDGPGARSAGRRAQAREKTLMESTP